MKHETDSYSEIAALATSQLERENHAAKRTIAPPLLVDFAIAAAVLAADSSATTIAQVIEFIDYQQHLKMTAGEVAAAVEHLEAKGFVHHAGGKLAIPDVARGALPRGSSGKLSVAKRDRRKWEKMILGE